MRYTWRRYLVICLFVVVSSTTMVMMGFLALSFHPFSSFSSDSFSHPNSHSLTLKGWTGKYRRPVSIKTATSFIFLEPNFPIRKSFANRTWIAVHKGIKFIQDDYTFGESRLHRRSKHTAESFQFAGSLCHRSPY